MSFLNEGLNGIVSMKYKKEFFTTSSPLLSTLHGVIMVNGRFSSGAVEFTLAEPSLRNLLIPEFYIETNLSKAPEKFRISNQHVVEATQGFFGVKTTKQVDRLPDTALDHFTMFVYGMLEGSESVLDTDTTISFKSAALAEDLEINFNYDFQNLDYRKEGTMFIFPTNTVLEIGWDVEDILERIKEDKEEEEKDR